jgi:hypothetical protein
MKKTHFHPLFAFALVALGLARTILPASGAEPEHVRVSGVYPHLAVYNDQAECGIGAVAHWADRLWAITYSPHKPNGSNDKLYSIDDALNISIFPDSVGGTPANRMVHRESNQLIIGPYFIDASGNVRVVPPSKMPGRLTANMRHLTEPERLVYFYTMEEGLYEVDVQDLSVVEIFPDGNGLPSGIRNPILPGYHGKGGYSGQGRIVVANNGEPLSSSEWLVPGPSGCLAEWDGEEWNVIARTQFNEVTGPGGIYGNQDENDPIWATGWDHKSLLLYLLDGGEWQRFRMPKGSHTFDGRHGWHTEWPRIRAVNDDLMLMNMHGTLYSFPKTFDAAHTGGIRPLSTYLKMLSDWVLFQDELVFACDDASKFDNGLMGQSNSNFWFLPMEQLDDLGPREGWGALWMNEPVEDREVSDRFFIHGYPRKVMHLWNNGSSPVSVRVEIDPNGQGAWQQGAFVDLPADGYQWLGSDDLGQGEWLRLRISGSSDSFGASLFMTDDAVRPLEASEMFQSLARPGEAYCGGIIRPRGEDLGTLHYSAHIMGADGNEMDNAYLEIGPEMELERVDAPDAWAWLDANAAIPGDEWSSDAASIILTDGQGGRWRLPRGYAGEHNSEYDSVRGFREVVTERSLLNCHGIFYEVPRAISGGLGKLKPIATHNRMITDYCSWRGLLVMTGVRPRAQADGHVFGSKPGLWFGVLDDLWKMGKPVGFGGPWLNNAVTAGAWSDPYLMRGFDEKVIEISHDQARTIRFTLEVDATDVGDWVPYAAFEVPAGETFIHRFPEGYTAGWLRISAAEDCSATAMLKYGPALSLATSMLETR